jgi:mucin-19
VSLTALGGGISESGLGAISTSGALSIHSSAGVSLGGANAVGSFGGTAADGITLDNTATTLTVTGALTTTQQVEIANTGNLALTGGLTTGDTSASAIVLSATGTFTNSDGATALSTGAGGRWLVYSAAPAGDSFGGLDTGNTAIWDATISAA